ncbi:cupin domain-containing protein [Micrococcus luteus]|uniref:cupin domain-containing protein n=1 Tax=Micrococcus luteus TaxID=1270 RepID=UPI00387974E9
MRVGTNGRTLATASALAEESVEVFPGARGNFTSSNDVTIARWSLEEGCVIPPHSHEHEQFVCMLEGQFEMQVGEETIVLAAGDNLYIPRNVLHSGKTMSTVKCIDVFNPARDDYRFFE